MKITLESTNEIIFIQSADGGPITHCRLWQGETDSGIPVHALIVRIGVPQGLPSASYEQFEAELLAAADPRPGLVEFYEGGGKAN